MKKLPQRTYGVCKGCGRSCYIDDGVYCSKCWEEHRNDWRKYK